MICKKCGYVWQTYGEHLTCPSCGSEVSVTVGAQQALWNNARKAKEAKDFPMYVSYLYQLAEQGNPQALYEYAEALRTGAGVTPDTDEAVIWYKSAARRLIPAAAYQLSRCLTDPRYGNSATQVYFWLRVSAEFGDSDAMYELSRCYEDGKGIAASHRHALFWLVRAGKHGQQDACLLLTRMYMSGDGVQRDFCRARFFADKVKDNSLKFRLSIMKISKAEALEPEDFTPTDAEAERLAFGERARAEHEYVIAANIFLLCAKKGNARANYLLGLCFEKGEGVPADPEEAKRRLRLSSDASNIEATVRLGDYACEGIGGLPNPDEALRCYKKAMNAGNAEAAFKLGYGYETASFVEEDRALALECYDKAASLGNEEAKERATALRQRGAEEYARGMNAYENRARDQAIALFRSAAAVGHPGAAAFLGELTEVGFLGTPDMRAAAKYYRDAARAGNLNAVYHLGICYLRGTGVPCDYHIARNLLEIAARKNYRDAEKYLKEIRVHRGKRIGKKLYSRSCISYRRGDMTEALRLRNIAASLGYARAMFVLGCHYEFGDGVKIDRDTAAVWYNRAAAAGFVSEGKDRKGAFLKERKNKNTMPKIEKQY